VLLAASRSENQRLKDAAANCADVEVLQVLQVAGTRLKSALNDATPTRPQTQSIATQTGLLAAPPASFAISSASSFVAVATAYSPPQQMGSARRASSPRDLPYAAPLSVREMVRNFSFKNGAVPPPSPLFIPCPDGIGAIPSARSFVASARSAQEPTRIFAAYSVPTRRGTMPAAPSPFPVSLPPSAVLPLQSPSASPSRQRVMPTPLLSPSRAVSGGTSYNLTRVHSTSSIPQRVVVPSLAAHRQASMPEFPPAPMGSVVSSAQFSPKLLPQDLRFGRSASPVVAQRHTRMQRCIAREIDVPDVVVVGHHRSTVYEMVDVDYVENL